MNGKRHKSGIHLMPDLPKKASLARQSNYRIEREDFIADIFVSKSNISATGEIFHYVIQRVGSPAVVFWGQETSMERAKDCLEMHLNSLISKQA